MSLPPEDERGTEPNDPIVLLPDEPEGFFRGRGPVWWLVAVLLAVGSVTGAVLLLRGGAEETAPAAVPEPSRAPSPREESPLAIAMDSLVVRLRAYRERKDRFDRGQVGCDGLAAAYQEVDRVFLDVAVAFRQRGAAADTSGTGRFDRLSTVADSVYRSFDATGCRRPG